MVKTESQLQDQMANGTENVPTVAEDEKRERAGKGGEVNQDPVRAVIGILFLFLYMLRTRVASCLRSNKISLRVCCVQ